MKQFMVVAIAVLCMAGFSSPSFSEMGQERLQMSQMKGEKGQGDMGGMKGDKGKPSEDPCGGGDHLPCLTTTIAPQTDGNCPNGGRKCAAPGAKCTKMSGANGTCVTMTGGGFCTCACM